ncbi:hypothetical protein CDAR_90431 [Caerostris darwini]|uniref:Uncharacterized protein n=1 Tax=Caerostris darwini TaxID=1538125 RepID=A0AAV4SVG0_9ARAC|nr:hypothetical protein CDAR_90431 [Caerostris darwini]
MHVSGEVGQMQCALSQGQAAAGVFPFIRPCFNPFHPLKPLVGEGACLIRATGLFIVMPVVCHTRVLFTLTFKILEVSEGYVTYA